MSINLSSGLVTNSKVKFGYGVTFFAPFFRQLHARAIGKPSARPMCGRSMCVAVSLQNN
jgi:hypothetical protein